MDTNFGLPTPRKLNHMKNIQLEGRPSDAGQKRLRWLHAIRKYVRGNSLPPVFRFRPRRLLLGTFRRGGGVSLEGKVTGLPLPIDILAWPAVSSSLTKDGKFWAVELVESQPGLACDPIEQLWRVRLANRARVPVVEMGRDGWLAFPVEIYYDRIGLGFENLRDKHLKILYTDVIEARPDLKVQ